MKYMLMICGGGDREPSPPRMGIEEWVTEMDGRGVRLFGRPLCAPESAATVRVRGGETLSSDGPFAETREYVAGFDVIDCADLDEAMEVAAVHPMAARGAVEIRPFASDFALTAQARAWAAQEPADSWVLFPCADGVFAGEQIEAAVERDARAWGEELTARGTLVFGYPLQPAAAATTVRVDGERTLVSDGPFAETREFIAGVSVLHGIGRQEAIALAARFPLAAHHRVEVRAFADR